MRDDFLKDYAASKSQSYEPPHIWDMSGLPKRQRTELFEADDSIKQLDNHSVLLEYGIDLTQSSA